MRRDDAYVLDMLLAAREAKEFATDLTLEEFQQDRVVQRAILKALEVVGDAASRLSNESTEVHQEIAWTKIIGMRNRLVHEYFNGNLARVWKTVQQDAPRLISQLELLVPPQKEQGTGQPLTCRVWPGRTKIWAAIFLNTHPFTAAQARSISIGTQKAWLNMGGSLISVICFPTAR